MGGQSSWLLLGTQSKIDNHIIGAEKFSLGNCLSHTPSYSESITNISNIICVLPNRRSKVKIKWTTKLLPQASTFLVDFCCLILYFLFGSTTTTSFITLLLLQRSINFHFHTYFFSFYI